MATGRSSKKSCRPSDPTLGYRSIPCPPTLRLNSRLLDFPRQRDSNTNVYDDNNHLLHNRHASKTNNTSVEDAKHLNVGEGDEDDVDESDEDAWDGGRDSFDESPLSGFSMRATEHEHSRDENNECEDCNE